MEPGFFLLKAILFAICNATPLRDKITWLTSHLRNFYWELQEKWIRTVAAFANVVTCNVLCSVCHVFTLPCNVFVTITMQLAGKFNSEDFSLNTVELRTLAAKNLLCHF